MTGDERLRLFLALRVPAGVLDEIEEWQRAQLPGVRTLGREQLHVTLAFLGHRPVAELDSILDALHAAAAAAGEIRLTPSRYRETRSVGMLVLEDEAGHATALAEDVQERLERLGIYERERRSGCPTSRWRAGASVRGCDRRIRRVERSFRPTRLLTFLDCGRAGRSTKSWNRWL